VTAAETAAPGPLGRAALDLADRRWLVIPCEPHGKRPLTLHGVNDATSSPDTIRGWWSRWPDANIGVATGRVSGLVVLDVDPRNGGAESLARLQTEHGSLPRTPTALTGGGGAHYLFAHPGAGEVRCRNGLPGYPGIDLKGDGGYVVAPPSTHPTGRPYSWQVTPVGPPAPCPLWLIELATARSNGGGGPHWERSGTLCEGERNDALASLAGHLRRPGLEPDEIADALRAANARRCQPPLADAEVQKIAQSIGRYPPGPEHPYRAYGAYRAPLVESCWPARQASLVGGDDRERPALAGIPRAKDRNRRNGAPKRAQNVFPAALRHARMNPCDEGSSTCTTR
jgi:hypothetical protein